MGKRKRNRKTLSRQELIAKYSGKKVADPTIYLPASDNIDPRQLSYKVRDKMKRMNRSG